MHHHPAGHKCVCERQTPRPARLRWVAHLEDFVSNLEDSVARCWAVRRDGLDQDALVPVPARARQRHPRQRPPTTAPPTRDPHHTHSTQHTSRKAS
eukprot:1004070-Rhodomonas_salina.1